MPDQPQTRSELPDFSAVLEHPCRACGANPGEMCDGGAMPKAGVPHPARVSDYMASVADGLLDRKARLSEWKDIP